MSRTQTRSQTRTGTKPPENIPNPPPDEPARRSPRRSRRNKGVSSTAGTTSPAPGDSRPSETAEASELAGLSPLTDQGELALPLAESTPAPATPAPAPQGTPALNADDDPIVNYGYDEGQFPWLGANSPPRETSASVIRRYALMDPEEMGQLMNDFMLDQSLMWTRHENPRGDNASGWNPGMDQARKIERMRNAIRDILREDFRAPSSRNESPVKREGSVRSTVRAPSRLTDYNDLYEDPAPTGDRHADSPRREATPAPRREFLTDVPGRPEYLNRDPEAIIRHIARQQEAERERGLAPQRNDRREDRRSPIPNLVYEPLPQQDEGRGNRRLARGGPPMGPPPPGPPGDDGPDDGSSGDDDPEEDDRDSEQGHGHQQARERNDRANRQYLRGYTPGNARYMGTMQNRYTRRIREMVGDPLGPVGPEIKAMSPPKPSKYDGQDDLEKFDAWLGQLLKYYRTFKIAGPDRDEDRVLYTGLYLEGIAAQWYDQEVESPDRRIHRWDFETLIHELFKRFVHEASAQTAADRFDRTRFDTDKGVLSFYNDLKRRARQMIQPPDDYSFRRKFIRGLPHAIIKSVFEARGISAEHSTIEEILDEVRRMESAQKAVAQHLRSGQGYGTKNPQKNADSTTSKKDSDEKASDRSRQFFKRGDTLYRRRGISRPNARGENNHSHNSRRDETRGNNPAKERKFLPGITCYRCKKEGHMAPDCDQPPPPEQSTAKRRLFAVDVRDDEQNEVQQGGTVSSPAIAEEHTSSTEGCEEASGAQGESLHALEDNAFDSFEEVSDVGDDDEPVAFFGAMHELDESQGEEHFVHCSMAHVVEDYEMPDLPEQENETVTVATESEHESSGDNESGIPASTGLPSRNWDWHPLFGAMHQGPCTECGLRAHHIMQGTRESTASLDHALDEPIRRAHAEYQRGVDLGRRTKIAYVEGTADAELPTVIRLMAEQLRIAENRRQAAQAALHEARSLVDEDAGLLLRRLDEVDHRLREIELLTGRVQVNADTVKITSPAGTLWVKEDGTVSIRPYRDEGTGTDRPRTWDDPIIMPELDEEAYLENAVENEPGPSSRGWPAGSPRWRWSRLFGAIHDGDSCSECHARAIHVTRHVLDRSANIESVLRYPSQLARRRYDEGWDDGNRSQPQGNIENHRRMTSALRILAGHLVHYRGIMREVSEDSAIRAGNLLRQGGTPTEIQHCINVFRRFDGMELQAEPRDVHIYSDDIRIMTPHGPVMVSRLGLPINPTVSFASMRLARVAEKSAPSEERTFRYAMRAKHQPEAAGQRPQLPSSMRNCATIRIQLNGCTAFTMIDTGSTGNFVSPAFAAVTNMETFLLEQQLTLQLGCIGSRSKISHGANTIANIGGLTTTIYVDIANIDRYDCILGMPFLRENDAVLDFASNVLSLQGDHNVELNETTEARSSNPRTRTGQSGPRSD